jgi:hypothetical protein
MKKFLVTIISVVFIIPFTSLAQESCEVLHPALSVEYTGDCKGGLAHGEGEATGVDHYTGEFRKGWPHGYGTYEWSTGERYEGFWKKGQRHGKGTFYFFTDSGKDTLVSGKWVQDEYVEDETREQAYKVEYKMNVVRTSIIPQGEGDEIRIRIFSKGAEYRPLDLSLIGDSGNVRQDANNMVFDDVQFPFEGKVTFTGTSALGSVPVDCQLRFVVFKPGRYDLYIYVQ